MRILEGNEWVNIYMKNVCSVSQQQYNTNVKSHKEVTLLQTTIVLNFKNGVLI